MAKKEKVVKVPSGIPGVMLVVKKEAENIIKVPFRAAQKFYSLIRKHRQIEAKEESLGGEKVTLKSSLVEFVSLHPGLTGLETEKDNLRTSIYESRSTETVYNREPLKKSLGVVYEGIVLEDCILTITLTPDYQKEKLIQFLKKFFYTEEIYKKLVREEVALRIDEEKLNQLITEKRVELQEGARVVQESVSWSVKTTYVKP